MTTERLGSRNAVAPAVPQIRAGDGAAPAACPAGHPGPHIAEPPLGRDRYGTVTCRVCGSLVAWVEAPLRTFTPAPEPARSSSARPPTPPSTPDWRRTGCTVACNRVQGHDPNVHESYGRRQATAELRAPQPRPIGVVRTGPLAIDVDVHEVRVDGVAVPLTATQRAIVELLATRLGSAVSYVEICDAVWGPEQTQVWLTSYAVAYGPWHAMRVQISRLRRRLGEAARLVETLKGTSRVRLLAEPPTDSGGPHGT